MAHRNFFALSLVTSALALAAPAHAQLLGGSGGLGGNLGGSLTAPLGQVSNTVQKSASGQGEARVDRRAGRVESRGRADAAANGNLVSDTLGSTAGTSGSAAASGEGSATAQLVGTDFIRQSVSGTASAARGTATTLANGARGTVGAARNQAASAMGGVAGSANGTAALAANGLLQGGMGQLAASGSAAASGAGMFAVEPGMPVTDARGKLIGHVQSLRQTKQGVVEAVTVETGNRFATLPAASFTGSGEALVTGMTKGELRQIAADQAVAKDAAREPAPSAAPASAPYPRATGGENFRAERGNVRED